MKNGFVTAIKRKEKTERVNVGGKLQGNYLLIGKGFFFWGGARNMCNCFQ